MQNQNKGNAQKQILKYSINLYIPPDTNELKPKSNPCIAYQRPHNSHNPQKHQIQDGLFGYLEICYKKLNENLKRQAKSFNEGCNQLRQMTHLYYEELIKILCKSQKEAIQQIDSMLNETQFTFDCKKKKIANSVYLLRTDRFKQNSSNLIAQLADLALLKVPTYIVKGICFPQFQKMISEYQPFFMQQANPQKPSNQGQKSQTSINKISCQNKTIPPTNPKKKVFDQIDFACDESFEWNPDQFLQKRERKQIVSQIIVEQPSSCQDSLIYNEMGELY